MNRVPTSMCYRRIPEKKARGKAKRGGRKQARNNSEIPNFEELGKQLNFKENILWLKVVEPRPQFGEALGVFIEYPESSILRAPFIAWRLEVVHVLLSES